MRWSTTVLCMVSILTALLAGCGNVYRSGEGGRGLMRVRSSAASAASGAMTHEAGREAHRGPPPLAGRIVSPHAPQVESIRPRFETPSPARVGGEVEGWSPSFADGRILPTSFRLIGAAEPDDSPVLTR